MAGPRILLVASMRDRLPFAIIFRRMDVEYDPECEAFVAMKLAAEADGAERQRWINAALALIELTRLRVPARRERGVTEEAI